jgi:hypothetical protein
MDADLNNFALGVVNGLKGNNTFPTPPVTVASLGTAQNAFADALAASNGGGVMQTAIKDSSHDALIGLLRQEALYVQQTAAGDQAKILSSGFQIAAMGHNPQAPMPKAVIKEVKNQASGQLLLRLQPILNAHAYEAQISTVANTWLAAGIYSRARHIVIPNLTGNELQHPRPRHRRQHRQRRLERHGFPHGDVIFCRFPAPEPRQPE